MIATPAWLAELYREQQSATPYFGLGFETSEVPQDIHARIADQARRCAHRFQPAPSSEEIRSVEPAIIPSVHLEDPAFDQEIGRALQASHEAWAGMKLQPSAVGGLRAYQRGSYLLRHVDRTSMRIISSTLCVDRKLDEPWPLRIEDINGRAHDFDLAPGVLLLYEGARLIHGRPWPLRGDYAICMSFHYRPQGLGIWPRRDGTRTESELPDELGGVGAVAAERPPGVHPLTNVDEGHLGGYIRASAGLPGWSHGDAQTWEPDVWRWAVTTLAAEAVLDVGCGEAHSTRFFRDLGCRVLGVDGSLQAQESSALPDRHVRHDFVDGPFVPDEGFDLVWSCEFVEHVEERFVGHCLATFAVARKAVLMTFAGPGQPGWHHVNCQPERYWVERVERLGFRLDRKLTDRGRALARGMHFARRGLVFVRAGAPGRL